MKKPFGIGLCILCGAFLGLAAESPFSYSIDPRIWGVDLGLGYSGITLIPERKTEFIVRLGGAYQTVSYFRDAAEALLITPSPADVGASEIQGWNLLWQFGIEQGIFPKKQGPAIEGFLYYLGNWDLGIDPGSPSLLLSSALPDRVSNTTHSVLGGLGWDTIKADPVSLTKKGYFFELSSEWGPRILSSAGTEYLRLNGTAKGLFPLFEKTKKGMNIVSGYVGDFFSVDASFGSQVPYPIRQSFGGRKPRTGLGDAVRGIDTARFDTTLKAVNNVEFRVNGPAFWKSNLIPILVLFLDTGYYDQVFESLALKQRGIIMSTGAGLFINLFDIATLGYYVDYALLGQTKAGNPFSHEIGFGLKF